MKHMIKLLFLSSIFMSLNAFALSPPWYLFQRQVNATLGRDNCVRVDQLQQASGNQYDLKIHVCRLNKAMALAAWMDRDEQIGNITVRVRVYYGNHLINGSEVPSNTIQARNLLHRALSGNRYYLGNLQGNAIYAFYALFSKSVVQYPGDNLADAYGNINEVAADAFQRVLGLNDIHQIRIGVTTARSNSLIMEENEEN